MSLKFSQPEKELLEALKKIEIIDCHEHLNPEKTLLGSPADIFTFFSDWYAGADLKTAGMSEIDWRSLVDRKIPLAQRWATFSPYWQQIRWSSYARAILLAVEKFYGFDDINEKTYQPLSEAMQKACQPGIYERVLRQTCNIRLALTQCNSTKLGTPLLVPVMPLIYNMENMEKRESLLRPAGNAHKGAVINSLDDYLDAVAEYILQVKSEGTVGLKMVSAPYGEPDWNEASTFFEKIKSGKEKIPVRQFPDFPLSNPLRDYVIDWAIKFAGEQGLVIAVHTGYWGDFRQLDPLHMLPILRRHPEVKFDIYHLGYPWVRETLMLGKGFPNVWLNLCWTHIISQRFATAALDEALDLVPMNKILAFGGDYSVSPEAIYGHLVMAQEDIARVLAGRMTGGQMTESQALALAQKWLWENPKKLYQLEL